jgi:hypothetical protein
MDASLKKCTSRQKHVVFLAMTFVIIVIIALLSPDLATAISIIGGLLLFSWAFIEAGSGEEKDGDPDANAVKEGFTAMPGAPEPYAVAVPMPQAPIDYGHYPGAIDIDEYDTEAIYGHRDRTEGDNENMPFGNPYNGGRISAPMSAAECIDDEANDGEMDGDEQNTYQARARNDHERVVAGTMNRRKDLDKYFREEVEEAEDREWWGRDEI